jgi:hypothetical protein
MLTNAASTPPRSCQRIQPFEAVGVGIVGAAVVVVVAVQLIGLRRELAAVSTQPHSALVSAQPLRGNEPGPEFHVDEPEDHFELAAPVPVFNVARGLRTPSVNAADGVTDLISLA